jgi:hypothetical protein
MAFGKTLAKSSAFRMVKIILLKEQQSEDK